MMWNHVAAKKNFCVKNNCCSCPVSVDRAYKTNLIYTYTYVWMHIHNYKYLFMYISRYEGKSCPRSEVTTHSAQVPQQQRASLWNWRLTSSLDQQCNVEKGFGCRQPHWHTITITTYMRDMPVLSVSFHLSNSLAIYGERV